jgi:hypothetical protein
MSPPAPYHFAVHLEEGVLGRAWLNDLPLHKVPTHGPGSLAGGANHLLVPGKNKLALEILTLPDVAPPPPAEEGQPPREQKYLVPVKIKVYQVVDASAEPMVANEMVNVELPEALGFHVWQKPSLPLYHEAEFELPFPVTEPVYWQSPPAHFSCAGTQELAAVVKDLHDSLMRRDLRRFLDLLSLKHEAFSAAFPGEPSAALDRLRSAWERFFALPYRVKPLDFTKVHFEPRSAGRVAYVSGWDDRPVLEAVTEQEHGPSLRANLLLTQHDGRWRVFG